MILWLSWTVHLIIVTAFFWQISGAGPHSKAKKLVLVSFYLQFYWIDVAQAILSICFIFTYENFWSLPEGEVMGIMLKVTFLSLSRIKILDIIWQFTKIQHLAMQFVRDRNRFMVKFVHIKKSRGNHKGCNNKASDQAMLFIMNIPTEWLKLLEYQWHLSWENKIMIVSVEYITIIFIFRPINRLFPKKSFSWKKSEINVIEASSKNASIG